MENESPAVDEKLKKDYMNDHSVAFLRFTYLWLIAVIASEIFFLLGKYPYLNWSIPVLLIFVFYLLYCRRVKTIEELQREIVEDFGFYARRLYSSIIFPLALYAFLRVIFLDLGSYEYYLELGFICLVLLIYAVTLMHPYREQKMAIEERQGFTRISETAVESFRNCLKFDDKDRIRVLLRARGKKYANARNVGVTEPVFTVTPYLYENLSESELNAVLAHELGHFVKGDVKRYTITGPLPFVIFAVLLILVRMFESVMFIPAGILGVLLIAYYYVSYYPRSRRKAELRADRYVSASTGLTESMIGALLKLSDLNMTPVGRMETGSASHPNIATRINYLKKLNQEQNLYS